MNVFDQRSLSNYYLQMRFPKIIMVSIHKMLQLSTLHPPGKILNVGTNNDVIIMFFFNIDIHVLFAYPYSVISI